MLLIQESSSFPELLETWKNQDIAVTAAHAILPQFKADSATVIDTNLVLQVRSCSDNKATTLTSGQINALLDVSQSAFSQLEKAQRVAEQKRGADTTLDEESTQAVPAIAAVRLRDIISMARNL